MTTLEERGNAILRQVWAQLQQASRERELGEIAANPDKHRLTRLMSEGGHTGYTYWPAGERRISTARKERTSFCVAKHKNAAGVFLIWRQVDRLKRKGRRWEWYQAERFDFQWAPTKKEAREIADRKAKKALSEQAAAAEAARAAQPKMTTREAVLSLCQHD